MTPQAGGALKPKNPKKPAHARAFQHARIIAKKAGKAIGKAAAQSPFSSANRHLKPALAHTQEKEARRAAEQFHAPRSYGHLCQESAFFRDGEQLARFAELLSQRGDKRTSIWSAGCATGEEPYSFAIIATEMFGREGAHARISITATDIDYKVLGFSHMLPKKKNKQQVLHEHPAIRGEYGADKARKEFALFFEDAGKGAPEAAIRRHFVDTFSSKLKLKTTLHSLVRFQQGDLVESAPVNRAGKPMKFDMVFCNNVLRHFDDKKPGHAADVSSAVSVLTGSLNDGGYLFLDHESDLLVRGPIAKVPGIERISGTVESKEGAERVTAPAIYQKISQA